MENTVSFISGLIKLKNIVSINGNEYGSCVIASKELGLDSRTVRKRVKSPSYPDWVYINKSLIPLSHKYK